MEEYHKFRSEMDKTCSFNELLQLYKTTNKTKKLQNRLIQSLIDPTMYVRSIPMEDFVGHIEEPDNNILNDMKIITKDQAQLNTINRIFNNRKNSSITNCDSKKIRKYCPHCNKATIKYDDTYYTICGYSMKGYDWKGCGNDWCFRCGKKLCKNWIEGQLFNRLNRYHDKNCCRLDAKKNNNRYPDEYCQCVNKHVYRQ